MPIPYYPNDNMLILSFMGVVMGAIAIIVAFYIAYREVKRKKLNLDIFMISALWMFAGALIGGNIAFLVFGRNYQYFRPQNIIYFFEFRGGFHSVGVILGGALGLLGYTLYKRNYIKKKYKSMSIYLARLADVWVLGTAIGIFFYRIGCFLTRDMEIGTVTNLPWAVLDNGIARHPVTLYYSLAGLIIFVVLLEIKKTRIAQKTPGAITGCFLLMYSFSRFSLDFLRVYEIKYWGVGIGQWLFGILFFCLLTNSIVTYIKMISNKNH